MIYEETGPCDFENTLSLLNSENESEKIQALLSIVLNGRNYELAMEKSIEFSKSESEWVKACGIENFGNIARLFHKLDLEPVVEIIKDALKSNSKIIRGKAESAIEDLFLFMKVNEKIFK